MTAMSAPPGIIYTLKSIHIYFKHVYLPNIFPYSISLMIKMLHVLSMSIKIMRGISSYFKSFCHFPYKNSTLSILMPFLPKKNYNCATKLTSMI